MIEVKHLTKLYGSKTAVSNLTFHIEKGEIYGLLGPNGAGKSTIMSILTGCLAASSGEVKIGGYDIFENPKQAKKLIGYLPEIPPLYPDRTPREFLQFVAEMKKIPSHQKEQEIENVMEQTRITGVADRLIRNLSKGYQQRVGIAQAVLGNPPIIILDEPTVGLDPKQIVEIRDMIRKLGQTHTVILSSHILSEVQAVCQKVLILSNGKLVACDTPENLEKRFVSSSKVELVTEAKEKEIPQILNGIPGVVQIRTMELAHGQCCVKIQTEQNQADSVCRSAFFAFANANRAILRMRTEKASLEEVYMELTSDVGQGV